MRRTILALAIALAAASAASAADHGLASLDEAWIKAMLAGDLDAVAALYAADAVMYPPDSMEARGRDAIRTGYEALFAGMKILDLKIVPAQYETEGDVSYGWGRFSLKMAPKAGGSAVQMEGRYMAVAKKIDGKWLYVADPASIPLPPAPKPRK